MRRTLQRVLGVAVTASLILVAAMAISTDQIVVAASGGSVIAQKMSAQEVEEATSEPAGESATEPGASEPAAGDGTAQGSEADNPPESTEPESQTDSVPEEAGDPPGAPEDGAPSEGTEDLLAEPTPEDELAGTEEAPEPQTGDPEASPESDIDEPGEEAETDQSVNAADSGTASITITSKNQQGDILPGGCYNIWSNEFGDFGTFHGSACDGEDNDGVSVLGGLMAGSYLVHTNWAPDGYIAGGSIPVELAEGETKQIDVVLHAGGFTISIETKDEQGTPLGGACYGVFDDEGGVFGSLLVSNCDGPQGGPYDGLTLIPGIPPGTYWLGQTTAPNGYAIAQAIQFSIGTEDIALGIVHSVMAVQLVIATVDESGAVLTGACYGASPVDGSGTGTSACDGDDGLDGSTTLWLAPGVYWVYQYVTPPGYIDVTGSHQVSVSTSGATHTEFVNAPGGVVILAKTDEHGQPLAGSCFWLVDAATGLDTEFRCDVSDGLNDGILHFDIVPGEYYAGESYAPPGYTYTQSAPFSVSAGQTTHITVQNVPGGHPVIVEKVDEQGAPLPGACFQVHTNNGGQPGEAVAGGCDWYDGLNDGWLTLSVSSPGSYFLVETMPPFGYQPGANQMFTLQAGGSVSLKVTNVKGDPEDWGTLVIRKVDPRDKLLPGACYALWSSDGATKLTSEPHCDGGHNDPDGKADGVYTFLEVAGTFLVEEYKAPEGYVAGDAQEVTVDPGHEKQITFVNYPKPDGKPDHHHPRPKPDKSHSGSKAGSQGVGTVTKLPDTGAGPSSMSGNGSLLMGLMTIAAVGCLAFIQRRKRSPA